MADIQLKTTWNAASQVTVTGASGALVPIQDGRKSLVLRSLSSNTQSIFYGPGTVTTVTGMEIKPGEIVSFRPGEAPSNAINAISASGSQVIIVQDSL